MRSNLCPGCMRETVIFPCPHCGYDEKSHKQMEYALPCNTILHGRYLVGKVLGQGGFGITYVGWDLALQVKCAIKEYFPNGQVTRNSSRTALDWYSTPQAELLRHHGMETFLIEARKMAKVKEIPQVVGVQDTFSENRTAYIVMDFVEGQTLKNRLAERGPLSWTEAKGIFFSAISAIEQVHQSGLIHRDLSPDNIMLLPDGQVRILDLGAAKDLTSNTGVSSMQVIKGGFSPIEQYGQSARTGPWTDVYAMAATIYYTLTGIVPPLAVDRMNEDVLDWNIPQLKGVPAYLVRALRTAMELQPQNRTQSMRELLDQLRSPDVHKSMKLTNRSSSTLLKWVSGALAALAFISLVPFLVVPRLGDDSAQAVLQTATVIQMAPTLPVSVPQQTESLIETSTQLEPIEAPTKAVYASSTYSGDRATHDATNLLDHDPKTNWTEGVDGYGVEEYVEFTFWDTYQLVSVWIRAGNRYDSNHYLDNSRPSQIRLTFSDGSSEDFTLNDIQSSQTLTLSAPVMTSSVRITILDVYKGYRYEDTVISDVSFEANGPPEK